MKLTKAKLKEIIREEIKNQNEWGQGSLGKDQADILDGIVRTNRKKGIKNILRIAMKHPAFKGVSKKELKRYIEENLMMMAITGRF